MLKTIISSLEKCLLNYYKTSVTMKKTLAPLIFLKYFILKFVKKFVDFNINCDPISKDFLKAYINKNIAFYFPHPYSKLSFK